MPLGNFGEQSSSREVIVVRKSGRIGEIFRSKERLSGNCLRYYPLRFTWSETHRFRRHPHPYSLRLVYTGAFSPFCLKTNKFLIPLEGGHEEYGPELFSGCPWINAWAEYSYRMHRLKQFCSKEQEGEDKSCIIAL